MKTYAFLRTIALALSLSGQGGSLHAQSLGDLFLKMPQEVCPALSEYNRLELVDNQRNNKPMQTRNLLNNRSTMQTLTDDYARLAVSSASERELKLLPLPDGSRIILMVSTVRCDSIADSSVSFYTTDWQPLDALAYFEAPTSTEFRRISVDPVANLLTVTTTRPLVLTTDESGLPAKAAPSSTRTWAWSTEEQKFIPHP